MPYRKKLDVSLDDGVPAWTEGITGLITGDPAMVSCVSCRKDCAESIMKKIENEFHCPKCWKKETADWLSVSSVTGMKKRKKKVGKGGTKIPEEPKKTTRKRKVSTPTLPKRKKPKQKPKQKPGQKPKKNPKKTHRFQVWIACLFAVLLLHRCLLTPPLF